MSSRDTELPQITNSPRDIVELISFVPEEAQPVEQPHPAPSVESQLRLIQSALNEERALRQQQADLATERVEGMRHELEAVAEARAEDRRFWRNFAAHVLMPVAVTAVLVFSLGFLVFHAGSPNPWDTPPPTASAQPAPARETHTASEIAPLAGEAISPSPEKYEMARLTGALRAVQDDEIPTVLGAVNQWLSRAGAKPCWVASPAGDVSLVISSGDPEHPLLSALSRCADAVEHVTGQ